MGSTRSSLVWSVPVGPDILAAHLSAYSQLHRKEIKALRLCRRFGQGDKAAINRLPVELLARIEDYLVRELSQRLLKECAREFKCWQGKCKPHEHLQPHDMWMALLDRRGSFVCKNCNLYVYDRDGACDMHTSRMHSLGDENVEDLDARLLQEFHDGDDSQWIEDHGDNADAWESTASGWSAVGTGIFDRNNDILRRDFGLEIWHSHTQILQPLGEKYRRLQTRDVGCSTLTYLVLPHGDFETILPQVPSDQDSSTPNPPWVVSENGDATEVILPKPISEKSIAAFRKAFQVLDLAAPNEPERPARPIYASDEDRSPCVETSSASKASGSTTEPWIPKLRLLVSTCLENE